MPSRFWMHPANVRKDTVQMVGHHHKCVRQQMGKTRRQSEPFVPHQGTRAVQNHHTIDHIAKHTGAVVGANRHKIRARLRIVVVFQPDGTAMVNIGVVCRRATPAVAARFIARYISGFIMDLLCHQMQIHETPHDYTIPPGVMITTHAVSRARADLVMPRPSVFCACGVSVRAMR